MTDKEMRKLSRLELLELLLEEMKENEKLIKENEDLKSRLEEKQIIIEKAGSIAEAALKLNKVFEAADAAAKQYIDSIKEQIVRGTGKDETTQTQA